MPPTARRGRGRGGSPAVRRSTRTTLAAADSPADSPAEDKESGSGAEENLVDLTEDIDSKDNVAGGEESIADSGMDTSTDKQETKTDAPSKSDINVDSDTPAMNIDTKTGETNEDSDTTNTVAENETNKPSEMEEVETPGKSNVDPETNEPEESNDVEENMLVEWEVVEEINESAESNNVQEEMPVEPSVSATIKDSQIDNDEMPKSPIVKEEKPEVTKQESAVSSIPDQDASQTVDEADIPEDDKTLVPVNLPENAEPVNQTSKTIQSVSDNLSESSTTEPFSIVDAPVKTEAIVETTPAGKTTSVQPEDTSTTSAPVDKTPAVQRVQKSEADTSVVSRTTDKPVVSNAAEKPVVSNTTDKPVASNVEDKLVNKNPSVQSGKVPAQKVTKSSEDRPYPASLAKLRQLKVNIGPIKQCDLKSENLHNVLLKSNNFEIKFELRDTKGADGVIRQEKLGFVHIPFEIRQPHYFIKLASILGNLHIAGKNMSITFPEAFNIALKECKEYVATTERLRKEKADLKRRQIVVKNVPPNVTEETIRSLFPEAVNITLSIEETPSGDMKVGSVLLDYKTIADCVKCLETNKDVFIEDCQLQISRLYTPPKTFKGFQGSDDKRDTANAPIRGGANVGNRGGANYGFSAGNKTGVNTANKPGASAVNKAETSNANKGGANVLNKGGVNNANKGGANVANKGGVNNANKGGGGSINKGGAMAVNRGGACGTDMGLNRGSNSRFGTGYGRGNEQAGPSRRVLEAMKVKAKLLGSGSSSGRGKFGDMCVRVANNLKAKSSFNQNTAPPSGASSTNTPQPLLKDFGDNQISGGQFAGIGRLASRRLRKSAARRRRRRMNASQNSQTSNTNTSPNKQQVHNTPPQNRPQQSPYGNNPPVVSPYSIPANNDQHSHNARDPSPRQPFQRDDRQSRGSISSQNQPSSQRDRSRLSPGNRNISNQTMRSPVRNTTNQSRPSQNRNNQIQSNQSQIRNVRDQSRRSPNRNNQNQSRQTQNINNQNQSRRSPNRNNQDQSRRSPNRNTRDQSRRSPNRNTRDQSRHSSGSRHSRDHSRHSPGRNTSKQTSDNMNEEDPMAMMAYLKSTLERMEKKFSQSASSDRDHDQFEDDFSARGQSSGRGGDRGVGSNRRGMDRGAGSSSRGRDRGVTSSMEERDIDNRRSHRGRASGVGSSSLGRDKDRNYESSVQDRGSDNKGSMSGSLQNRDRSVASGSGTSLGRNHGLGSMDSRKRVGDSRDYGNEPKRAYLDGGYGQESDQCGSGSNFSTGIGNQMMQSQMSQNQIPQNQMSQNYGQYFTAYGQPMTGSMFGQAMTGTMAGGQMPFTTGMYGQSASGNFYGQTFPIAGKLVPKSILKNSSKSGEGDSSKQLQGSLGYQNTGNQRW